MHRLIRNCETVAILDDDCRDLPGGWIETRGGVIEGVGAAGSEPKGPFDETIDAAGLVVTPGLVNTHHHFFQTLTRATPAAANAELFQWLVTHYPIWSRIDRDAMSAAATVALGEMMLSGCTLSSDHHYLFSKNLTDPIDAAIESATALGVRFTATRGSMTLSEKDGGLPPDSVVQDEKTVLKDSARTIEQYHDTSEGAMIQVALAPCSPFTVTQDLMRETAKMARAYKVRMHTHLAETLDEDEYCLAHFKVRPLQYLEDVEWLGSDAWLAHGVHFKPDEQKKLGACRCGIAHCPTSNMRLASGIAPTLDYRANGIPLGLGVDGSASNDASSLSAEARQALLLGRIKYGAAALTIEEVLRWATRGGAEILGRPEVGRIAKGLRADLAFFPLDDIAFSGAVDPLAAIVLCGPVRVQKLLIEGRWVIDEGRLLPIDLRTTLAAHRAASKRIVNG